MRRSAPGCGSSTTKTGKLNRSARDNGYSALVVSQFTLYGDTKKGMRPQLHPGRKAAPVGGSLRPVCGRDGQTGLKEVKHGEFGADMQVALVNEGPCTIVMDTDEWKKGD